MYDSHSQWLIANLCATVINISCALPLSPNIFQQPSNGAEIGWSCGTCGTCTALAAPPRVISIPKTMEKLWWKLIPQSHWSLASGRNFPVENRIAGFKAWESGSTPVHQVLGSHFVCPRNGQSAPPRHLNFSTARPSPHTLPKTNRDMENRLFDIVCRYLMIFVLCSLEYVYIYIFIHIL